MFLQKVSSAVRIMLKWSQVPIILCEARHAVRSMFDTMELSGHGDARK